MELFYPGKLFILSFHYPVYFIKYKLTIFFLPPYSPHLNLAETLWRILKGKWIKPQDYISKDNLFYAANSALANVGKVLYVNFKNNAV
jgi:transposase